MNPAWYILIAVVALIVIALVIVHFGLERRWPMLARYLVRIPSAMVLVFVGVLRAPFRRTPPG